MSRIPPRLKSYFDDYARFHQNPANLATHYVGIPLIVVSILGLLALVRLEHTGSLGSGWIRFDLGMVLLAAVVGWFLFLDWRLTLPFSLSGIGLYYIGRGMPVPLLLLLFVAGWALQLLGHAYYEKQKPAFAQNLLHLLIGPLWIFAKLIGWGREKSDENALPNR